MGDHDALRRAVGDLLSNAVRLAPGGGEVVVAAGRTGEGPAEGEVPGLNPLAEADPVGR